MHEIPTIDTLRLADTKPGTTIDIRNMDEFDHLALTVGRVLLDGLRPTFEHRYTFADPERTFGRTQPSNIASKLGSVEEHSDVISAGAIFVEPTRPGNIRYVQGEQRQFVSVLRTRNDLVHTLETTVFIELLRRRDKEELLARKQIGTSIKTLSRVDFVDYLHDHLLEPRMRDRSHNNGQRLSPLYLQPAS